MRWQSLLVVAGLISASPVLLAQGEVRGTEVGEAEGEETVGESRIARIHAVERGLWFSVDYGPYYQIPSLPGMEGQGLPQRVCRTDTFDADCAVGQLQLIGSQIGLRVGYDVLNNIEVDGFIRGTYANFLMDYAQVYSGDVAATYAGVGARFSYVTTDRLHLTLRAGGGLSVLLPARAANAQASESDLAVFSPTVDVAAGVEYYTQLRHISIGVEVSTIAFIVPLSLGFTAMPTFKYTF